MLYGIDPGSYESAIVAFDGKRIHFASIMRNDALLSLLRRSKSLNGQVVAIEAMASYGMPVGAEVFTTVEWAGRFREASESNGAVVQKVFRKDVKMHLCHTMKATDANISTALRDKYGDMPKQAKITLHLWAAFAVADYALTHKPG